MEKLEFDLKTELISDAVINFAVGFAGIQDDDRKADVSVGFRNIRINWINPWNSNGSACP